MSKIIQLPQHVANLIAAGEVVAAGVVVGLGPAVVEVGHRVGVAGAHVVSDFVGQGVGAGVGAGVGSGVGCGVGAGVAGAAAVTVM